MRTGNYERNADEIDHIVLECAAHGYSKAQICACIGISRGVLSQWANAYPRFNDILQQADVLSQAWWEGRAMDGTAQTRIGGTIWNKSVTARFPHDYAERVEKGKIGETGKKVQGIKWKVIRHNV